MTNKVTQEKIDSILGQATFDVQHAVFGKVCIVTAKLSNGFTIVGTGSCVDPANYDEEIGFNIALKQIENKLWELEGYLLQSKLYGEN